MDILAFGAHPDDIEFGCGGILAKAAFQGHSILLVDLSRGEMSTHGTPEIRHKEAEVAASLINASRLFLDFADGQIVDGYEGRLKLVKIIRAHKPKLVIAPLWKGEQNHPDHLACGLMARYACRYARFAKILPELPPHHVEGILHYLPHVLLEPDILIDVSDHVEIWKKMMYSHESQMKTFHYADRVLVNAARLGAMIHSTYAQGLVSGNPIQVEDIMFVSKGILEF